ncbi:MAG: tetratricopeptide repeat protein [Hyphomonadaceae bacterium]
MYKFVITVMLASCAIAAAHAQHWGLQQPGAHLGDMGVVTYQSRDWAQCSGGEQIAPQRAISACGRIIGERMSRDLTAAAYFYRSELYRQEGDAQRADADVARSIELLAELIRAEPDDPNHANDLAYLRLATRDYVNGAADFARLAAMRPQAVEPRLRQGEFLFRARDFLAAAAAFDAAAQLYPANAQAQSGRCEARAAANTEIELARQACEEALRLSDQSAAALFSRGYLNFTQGHIEEAFADFGAAGQKDNTHPYSAYGYAVAGIRLGHEEQGRALLAQGTAAVPDVEIYAGAGLRP